MTTRKILKHPDVKILPKRDQEIVIEMVKILTKHKKLGAIRLAESMRTAFEYEMSRRRYQEEKKKVHANRK